MEFRFLLNAFGFSAISLSSLSLLLSRSFPGTVSIFGFGASYRPIAFGFAAPYLVVLWICLFYLLLLFLSVCRFRFRLEGGFEARFQLNTFGSPAPCLFFSVLCIYLFCSLFLFLRLFCFCFLLNGGMGASFLLNAFDSSAPSLLLSVSTSFSFPSWDCAAFDSD
jgi:hypothetical protein